jgi:hypothetical protein
MRKSLPFVVLLAFFFSSEATAQAIKLQEGFETSDTLHLPTGWTRWVMGTGVPADSLFSNWTVRDTGLSVTGLATATSKAHNGLKAVGVSWNVGGSSISDAWLITKRVRNVQAGDSLRFWATGGTTNYGDSLQVWISGQDSLPATQETYLRTLYWPTGSTYGLFQRYAIDISLAAGFDVWIGFRYYGDFSTSFGFFVQLDDISVGGVTSVEQTDPAIPERFGLSQNYPNPFNPTTTIGFHLPKSSFTTLKIYNALGQEVATLVDKQLSPGTFKSEWDASGMASGMYFARLTAGQYTETRKLMLVK